MARKLLLFLHTSGDVAAKKVKEKRVNGFLGVSGGENSAMDGLLRSRRWK
ncbi:hypothetical protein Lalb_Chr13g0304151 [Lupinus albus]|uniref:Uncharacterized protein n=1 Tax=Lupinus albus TaxID=3870 RepID=A0A6A4PKE2_LUPAL|nr:hypothetical protein Lalb_Chr13g0304151 [Lupinus albus]